MTGTEESMWTSVLGWQDSKVIQNPGFPSQMGWKRFVPDHFQQHWEEIPFEVQIGIYITACYASVQFPLYKYEETP